jgi:hypothetical protein
MGLVKMSINIKSKQWDSYSEPSEFALAITKLLYLFAILFLASVFATSLFDIRSYIEDHNFIFEYFEYLVLLGFIISYYAPWSIIAIVFNKRGHKYPEIISVIASVVYMFSIWYIVTFMWCGENNVQRELFSGSLTVYLINMFFINILLNFNDTIEKLLESSIDIYVVPKIFRSRIDE